MVYSQSSAILRKWNSDVDLLKEDVGMCRSSYARVMIELWADLELKYNIVVAMPKIMGERGFKPHKEYRIVPKKPNASSSGNKKKDVKPTNEVSKSNPFEVLNSVYNDVELDLLMDGQAILVDEADNPLKKVEYLGDYDSEDEVA
ncbi:hypothetical protein Tco_1199199 [Tanacetum coccineum]